jgi:serine/threonine-protein kinase HipA
MRKGIVRVKGKVAGRLEEIPAGYRFSYVDSYRTDPETLPVSLTLPKSKPVVESHTLFPFFYGLLAEGNLKAEQCRRLKLDEDDAFGRLLKTAGSDTIGAVTVEEETS